MSATITQNGFTICIVYLSHGDYRKYGGYIDHVTVSSRYTMSIYVKSYAMSKLCQL